MNNPIIQRELIGTLRTGKALALQVALAAVLTILVILKWPGDALRDLDGSRALEMVRVFGYGLMAAIMLLAPAFPATSIVQEKQQGTLTLLLNSPMTRGAILTGKVVGAMGFMVLVLVLSVPAAVACYVMGGVDPKKLIEIYMLLILLSIQYTAMGLWVSSMTSTADSALRVTYGLVLILSVISLGPWYFTRALLDIVWLRELVNWIGSLSPIPSMLEAMMQGGFGSMGVKTTIDVTARFATTSLILSAIFLIWTALRLDLRIFDRARPAGKVTDEQTSRVRTYRRIMYLWFFDPQRRSSLIGPMTNPVMAKEFRSRRFGRSNWMIRMILGCLVISLLLTLATATGVTGRAGDVNTVGGILVILQMALLILLTPSLASSLISGELESGGWQLMQMTPLTPATIVFGKLLSVMLTLLLVLLATLPGYAVLIYINPANWVSITNVLITMLMTALFALLVTATISSFFRRTASSTTVAYTVLIGLVAGTLLLWLGREGLFSHSMVQMILTVNPIATALSLIKSPAFVRYELVPANWWFMGVGCVLCLFFLVGRTWWLTRPR